MNFHKKNKLVLISCLILIVTGITFIGILLSDSDYLLAFYQKYISIVFNSSLCLILIGTGYMLLHSYNRKARAFVLALSLLLTTICVLTILEHLFHFDAGIDEFLVPGQYADPTIYHFIHGQMLPATAVVYLFLGLALIGFCTKIRLIHVLSQYFLHMVSVFCSILLIGFAYSSVSFVDLQTHILNYLWLGGWIITLSIAASFRHPSLGLTRLFSGTLVGNKMARRLFAMMAVSILLFGLVKVKYLGFSIWQYDTGISLFVFCILVTALLIIWHTANWLNRIDLRRINAENELKVLNGELGKRVEERTADLQKSKANLGAILETSSTGYALLDTELNIVTFNQRAMQFVNLHFGVYPKPGDNPVDFLPKERMSVLNKYVEEVLQGGNISDEVDYPQQDGTSFFYNVSMSPISNNQKEIVGMMLAISDITDIKNYTNAIEKQNKNLLEIAWLQSHIVRAPLARMMGIINLLRNHDLDHTEYDEYLMYLSTSADELDAIIKDITNKTEEIK